MTEAVIIINLRSINHPKSINPPSIINQSSNHQSPIPDPSSHPCIIFNPFPDHPQTTSKPLFILLAASLAPSLHTPQSLSQPHLGTIGQKQAVTSLKTVILGQFIRLIWHETA